MSHYQYCCQNIGRPVLIRTVDGREHRGVISRVTNSHVYLTPLQARERGLGFGFYGYGYPWRPGFGWGVALGAIATVALLPFFFW
ncbi:hypothetical protein [Amphibacillus sediminis]|uniref:hypothetical protein n=1 Tax=Amphibacillus sediminis TaxID=360185 RepID=UPI000833104D|nr:hypothetical protein [Amphibacillus sediminis]